MKTPSHRANGRGLTERIAPDMASLPNTPTTNAADLRWLKTAEHWGEWIRFPDDRPGEPERIWLLQGGSGARFYGVGKGQIGPRHQSIYVAALWAWANRWFWTDEYGDFDILSQLACRKWVLAGGAA